MKAGSRQLPAHLCTAFQASPETGMGYQVATVVLADGRRIQRVYVVDCQIVVSADGAVDLPFDPQDVVTLEVTHDKRRPQ